MSQNNALIYGTGIFIMTFVSGMSGSHMMFTGMCVGTKVRVAITNLIYQKVRCVHCAADIISKQMQFNFI